MIAMPASRASAGPSRSTSLPVDADRRPRRADARRRGSSRASTCPRRSRRGARGPHPRAARSTRPRARGSRRTIFDAPSSASTGTDSGVPLTRRPLRAVEATRRPPRTAHAPRATAPPRRARRSSARTRRGRPRARRRSTRARRARVAWTSRFPTSVASTSTDVHGEAGRVSSPAAEQLVARAAADDVHLAQLDTGRLRQKIERLRVLQRKALEHAANEAPASAGSGWPVPRAVLPDPPRHVVRRREAAGRWDRRASGAAARTLRGRRAARTSGRRPPAPRPGGTRAAARDR